MSSERWSTQNLRIIIWDMRYMYYILCTPLVMNMYLSPAPDLVSARVSTPKLTLLRSSHHPSCHWEQGKNTEARHSQGGGPQPPDKRGTADGTRPTLYTATCRVLYQFLLSSNTPNTYTVHSRHHQDQTTFNSSILSKNCLHHISFEWSAGSGV